MTGPYLYVVEGGSAFEAAVRRAATAAISEHANRTTDAHGGIVSSADGRLSNARTPTAHKASHAAGGTDALSAADVGAIPAAERGAANGVAELVGGLLPTSRLPALSINDTFPVASQAAMLALTAQKGDMALRSDTNRTYVLAAEPASVLANWLLLPVPADLVQSVNGQTGVVNLSAGDVGATPSARTISTAAPLTGGGDLSANRTLGVEDVAGLIPDTYERATVTVDAKGRVTSIATGAPGTVADASATVKGASRLSTAPASATDPLAVGDNDPRVNGKAKGIFRATKTTGQTISSSAAATNPSPTTITWQTEEMDVGGGLDVAGNRFVVPAGFAGFWSFEAYLTCSAPEDGSGIAVSLLRNGTAAQTEFNSVGSVRFQGARCRRRILLAAGDVITVQATYSSPGADSFNIETSDTGSYFEGEYKGSA